MVSGRPRTTASPDGPSEASGRRSSRRCASMTTSARSSTARWSGRTRMRPEEKGGPTQCFGPLSRRFFVQAPRDHHQPREAASHHPHARTTARLDGSGASDRARDRQSSRRRCGVRLRRDRRRGLAARHEIRHRDESRAKVQLQAQSLAPSIVFAEMSSPSSMTSNASEPSPAATRRQPPTIWRPSTSPASWCRLIEDTP